MGRFKKTGLTFEQAKESGLPLKHFSHPNFISPGTDFSQMVMPIHYAVDSNWEVLVEAPDKLFLMQQEFDDFCVNKRDAADLAVMTKIGAAMITGGTLEIKVLQPGEVVIHLDKLKEVFDSCNLPEMAIQSILKKWEIIPEDSKIKIESTLTKEAGAPV